MWMVFNLDTKPGAERAANDDGEPVIVDTIGEAARHLGERIQFSLGYLADPDSQGESPPLPFEVGERLAHFVRTHADAPRLYTYLRYDTPDGYAHIMVLVTPFAGAGFRTAGVAL